MVSKDLDPIPPNFVFLLLLLRLSDSNGHKKSLFSTAYLNIDKRKNHALTKKKRLVGLAPD